jgi:hypothetical protein
MDQLKNRDKNKENDLSLHEQYQEKLHNYILIIKWE